MMNTKIKLFLFSLLLFAFTLKVNAAVGSINIPGATINVGDTKQLTVTVSGGLMAADGTISSNDSSCVQIVSGGGYFIKVDYEGNPISVVANVTIKGLKGCSTTLQVSNASVSSLDGVHEDRGVSFTSGTITVKEKEPEQASSPSQSNNTQNNSNNTSSSSSQSSSSSSSNSSNTTSTNAATNASSIVKKNGSSNNSLSSLSVTNYNLDKKFNTNTTSYSISVASDVKSINVNAKASDSKAKVTIYGTNSLKAGKNTVSVVVVAENGDKKTYTITVNKEKGSNDTEEVVEEPQTEEEQQELVEKSDDNSLNNIKPSIGILSPAFDKNKTKYVIYLPFEVEEISFETELSDPNATVEVTSVEKLKVGDNKYTFKVTAQNGSEKQYFVTVKRGIDPEVMDNKNSFLKALNLTSGKLTKKFDKNIYEYYYKGKNIKIKALAEDENANVDVIKNGDVYYVKVTSPSGETSIYTLRPYKFYNTLGFKIGVGSGGFVAGFVTKTLLRRYFLKRKAKKVSSKK